MKYSFLAVALVGLILTACDGKKHPMDKPPPSASVERDSAPKFDELDPPSTGAGAPPKDASNVRKEEPKK